jgi:ribosomal protein S18 acetylase RimI-like enzyme
MEIPKIRVANEDEREEVLSTAILGFGSDPLVRWMWPHANNYLDARIAFNAFCGRAIDAGSAYVTPEFEGVALWLPPGIEPDEETMMAELTRTVSNEVLDFAIGVFEAMSEYHPQDPCWYLPVIGVDPAFQGKGFGSALMKHALKRCDDERMTAYLESSNPRNIPLYERHGFSVIGKIQIGSSPTIHPMIRECPY